MSRVEVDLLLAYCGRQVTHINCFRVAFLIRIDVQERCVVGAFGSTVA